MNRRTMLKVTGAAAVSAVLPVKAIAKVEPPWPMHHEAFMIVNNQMLEYYGPWFYGHGHTKPNLKLVAACLHLPANCEVLSISPHVNFLYNQSVLRLRCPDFVATKEAYPIPEVVAWYRWSRGFIPLFSTARNPLIDGKMLDDAPKFQCWMGPAVSGPVERGLDRYRRGGHLR